MNLQASFELRAAFVACKSNEFHALMVTVERFDFKWAVGRTVMHPVLTR
jgi:hypothetical protein